jgi:hypothetical protein
MIKVSSMGSYFVHAGYALKVKPQQVTRTVEVIACTNVDSCSRTFTERSKFCKHCGSPLAVKPKQQNFMSSYHDDLLPSELSYLVSQISDTNIWRLDVEISTADGHHSIDGHLQGQAGGIEFDLQAMVNAGEQIRRDAGVKRIMEYMTGAYGLDAIELVFGTFGYWK